MKTNKPFKLIRNVPVVFLTGLFLVAFIVYNCKDDTEGDDPPQLPPEESFIIDFSDFDDSSDTLSKSTLTHKNWGHTFFKAGVWNLIITVTGIVPVTAFMESFKHQAVYEGNSTWVWTYDYTIGSATYTAKLKGKII